MQNYFKNIIITLFPYVLFINIQYSTEIQKIISSLYVIKETDVLIVFSFLYDIQFLDGITIHGLRYTDVRL